MVKTIRYGFEYNGILYGWIDKELFRIKSNNKKKHLPLKKLNLIYVGNKKGYRISGDRKTIEQLSQLNKVINFKLQINGAGSKDCPF